MRALILLAWIPVACASQPTKQLEHGTFRRLPDGGYFLTECARDIVNGQVTGPVHCENVTREKP